jgi:hypothetical protein
MPIYFFAVNDERPDQLTGEDLPHDRQPANGPPASLWRLIPEMPAGYSARERIPFRWFFGRIKPNCQAGL